MDASTAIHAEAQANQVTQSESQETKNQHTQPMKRPEVKISKDDDTLKCDLYGDKDVFKFKNSVAEYDFANENGIKVKLNPVKKYAAKIGEREVIISVRKNGTVEQINQYNEDGKLDGEQLEWHDNGHQWYIMQRKNGNLHGEQKLWYENGQQEFIHHLKNGSLHGDQCEWYPNGNQKYIMNYTDNKQDGKQLGWYENGQQEYDYFAKNDAMEGVQVAWCSNGEKKHLYNYKHGKLHGIQEEWNDKGESVSRQSYKNGNLV